MIQRFITLHFLLNKFFVCLNKTVVNKGVFRFQLRFELKLCVKKTQRGGLKFIDPQMNVCKPLFLKMGIRMG